MGMVMFLVFMVETIVALAQRTPFSFGFWSWVSAGETAAWRLKWIAFPVLFVVLWIGRRIYQSMMQTPERFVGLKMARRGLLASAVMALLFVTLIGVTVPARLRHRQWGIESELLVRARTYVRATIEYEALYGKLPNEKKDLYRLPDPDGSIAAALADIDPTWYRTTSTIASDIPRPSRRSRTGAALVKASATTSSDDSLPGDLSSTNYELRLPGEDKVYGNDDDLIVRDGVIMSVTEAKEKAQPAGATARSRKP